MDNYFWNCIDVCSSRWHCPRGCFIMVMILLSMSLYWNFTFKIASIAMFAHSDIAPEDICNEPLIFTNGSNPNNQPDMTWAFFLFFFIWNYERIGSKKKDVKLTEHSFSIHINVWIQFVLKGPHWLPLWFQKVKFLFSNTRC